MINDPDREPELDATALRRVYALTDTEAEVDLRVAQGDGLKPVAGDLSVSTTTIRTHLQHAFDKTGTDSRSRTRPAAAVHRRTHHGPAPR